MDRNIEQVNVKIETHKKAEYVELANQYGISLSALVRMSLDFVQNNKPALEIRPTTTLGEQKKVRPK